MSLFGCLWFVWLCVCLSVCLFVCLFVLSVPLFACLSVCLFLYLSVRLPVCGRRPVHLPVCLFACLRACLFARRVCVLVRLSMWLCVPASLFACGLFVCPSVVGRCVSLSVCSSDRLRVCLRVCLFACL